MGLAPQYPSWVIGLRTERHMMAAAYPQAFQHCRARNVRFGSEADMCGATSDVRFTPNSDRKSRPQTVMSALPPKADMCSAARDVGYGLEADSDLSASSSSVSFRPSALAQQPRARP